MLDLVGTHRRSIVRAERRRPRCPILLVHLPSCAHQRCRLRLLLAREPSEQVAQFMVPTALHRCLGAEYRVDRFTALQSGLWYRRRSFCGDGRNPNITLCIYFCAPERSVACPSLLLCSSFGSVFRRPNSSG